MYNSEIIHTTCQESPLNNLCKCEFNILHQMEANNFNSSLRKHTQLTHKSKSICYASQGQRQSLFLLCLSSVVFSHTRFALICFLCMLRRELWNMFERRTGKKTQNMQI